MEALNRKTAHANSYPEKIIQFGEGNFLRAFVDWIIWKTNQKTDFNAGVVLVQPIDKGMVDMINSQDGLYHLNLQGIDKGKAVDSIEMIDVINRGINPYRDFDDYLALAENPEIRFIISNTTEAGIAFDPQCKFTDRPAASYPGKLTQLLYHRYEFFKGDKSKGFIIFPCELIFLNGKELKKCIHQYIELWQLGDGFREWFDTACGVYCTLGQGIPCRQGRAECAFRPERGSVPCEESHSAQRAAYGAVACRLSFRARHSEGMCGRP